MAARRLRRPGARRRGGGALAGVRYRAAPFCLASLVFALVGYELGRHPTNAIAFVGLVAAASLFLFATDWPWLPFAAGLFLLAMVPVYWVPFTFHVLPLPGVVVLGMVAGASVLACLSRRESMTLSGLDVLVALLLLAMGLSAAVHERKFIEFFDNVLQWGVPYLAARISVGRVISATTFARIFAISGLVLVPFVALEALTGQNLFARFSDNPAESLIWGLPLYRGSILRAQASFGQPIALSMFLGSATAFAAALAIGGHPRASRERWAAAGIALGIATLATVSRTGEVVLLVSLLGSALLFATSTVDYGTRRRALGFLAGAVGLLLVAVVVSSHTRTIALSIFGSETGAAGTATARVNLLTVVGFKYFSWLGQQASVFQQAGVGSVDNTWLWMLSLWGVFATALLLATLAPMVRHLIRRQRQPSMRTVIVAVAAGNIVGLTFVVPITQEQDVIFVLLGAASAALVSGARSVGRDRDALRRSTALDAEVYGHPGAAVPVTTGV